MRNVVSVHIIADSLLRKRIQGMPSFREELVLPLTKSVE